MSATSPSALPPTPQLLPIPSAPLSHYPRNSLQLNSFADPHPVNPVLSILYKNAGGRGSGFSATVFQPVGGGDKRSFFSLPRHILSSLRQDRRCPAAALQHGSSCVGFIADVAHHSFKSFSCNTYGPSRKCCKQRTYGFSKSFRCNTYKKPGGASLKPKAALRERFLYLPTSSRSDVPTLALVNVSTRSCFVLFALCSKSASQLFCNHRDPHSL